jgi:hypothetical protein
MGTKPGHNWKLLEGSNSTYTCTKCGILGHPPDRYSSNFVQPNRYAPLGGICELNTILGVMSV